MDQLIMQYKEALRQIKETRKENKEIIAFLESKDSCPEKIEKLVHDDKIIAGMESDLKFAIEWMTTSKQPGTRRGIERRSVYQNTKLVDPLLMQRYFRSEETTYSWDMCEKENVISSTDKQNLREALSILSKKEKEVYMMSRGYGLSYKEIARRLKVKKSTVQTLISRAETKLARFISSMKDVEMK